MSEYASFAQIAAYYDSMYVNEERYRDEVEQATAIITKYNPTAKTLLDIACGTGAQAKYFANRFDVTGLDISAEMLEYAKAKVPAATFAVADMCDFCFDTHFDAIVNLYGSIGFAPTYDAMQASLRCCYKHMNDGGVLILTPWSTKETFEEGLVAKSRREERDGFCRMEAIKRIADNKVQGEMHHLVAADLDITYHKTVFEISLFSEDEYLTAIKESGFTLVERLPETEFRMGAFICVKEVE